MLAWISEKRYYSQFLWFRQILGKNGRKASSQRNHRSPLDPPTNPNFWFKKQNLKMSLTIKIMKPWNGQICRDSKQVFADDGDVTTTIFTSCQWVRPNANHCLSSPLSSPQQALASQQQPMKHDMRCVFAMDDWRVCCAWKAGRAVEQRKTRWFKGTVIRKAARQTIPDASKLKDMLSGRSTAMRDSYWLRLRDWLWSESVQSNKSRRITWLLSGFTSRKENKTDFSSRDIHNQWWGTTESSSWGSSVSGVNGFAHT